MGTWSHHPFGNDSAGDWAYGLDDAVDLSLVEQTLDRVLEAGDDYLDASDAEEAIAAIELLAKLLGRGTQRDGYTETVDAWVAAHPLPPPPRLTARAIQVLDRILGDDSELAELWAESGDDALWRTSVAQLRAAMGGD